LQLFGDENALAPTRWDCGKMDIIYGFYSAKMWIKERLAKLSNINPQFFMCCENGKVLLLNLLVTLQELEVLLTSKERSAVKFGDEIRMYNLVLAFISLGAKVDESITRGTRPYSFRFRVSFITKSDPCVLSKDNIHSLHSCTFMIWITNIKIAMLLNHRLIQQRWISC